MTERTTELLPNHCRHCGKVIYTSTKVERSLAGPGTPYVVRTLPRPPV